MFKNYKQEVQSWAKQLEKILEDMTAAIDCVERDLSKYAPNEAEGHVQRFRKLLDDIYRVGAGILAENQTLKKQFEESQKKLSNLQSTVLTLKKRMEEIDKKREKQAEDFQSQIDAINQRINEKSKRAERSFRSVAQAIVAAQRIAGGGKGAKEQLIPDSAGAC